MLENKDTIFALASGFIKAGISVIRISGNDSREVFTKLTGKEIPETHKATLCKLKNTEGTLLDEAICIYFQSPNSYTGEDVLELQIHGGRAVVKTLLAELGKIKGLRLAERGEFTKRAVLNGKMDITEAEGINDLINAETYQQVRQALKQMGGELSSLYDSWRTGIIHILAFTEAYIDFPEEEIPSDIETRISDKIRGLQQEIKQHLCDDRGQKLRDGYNVAIIGAVNAGKSSLLNKLVKKEAAIVSSMEGTTRDVVEVFMDLNGFPVIFADTAGLRETADIVEQEGIRRALIRANNADLKLAVFDGSKEDFDEETLKQTDDKTLIIINKQDITTKENKEKAKLKFGEKAVFISTENETDIKYLLDLIENKVRSELEVREAPAMTQLRHKDLLQKTLEALTRAEKDIEIDLKAEDLRLAARYLGKITGSIDVEEILDVVFKEFCIGK
jgi:tRNA modification GTPase